MKNIDTSNSLKKSFKKFSLKYYTMPRRNMSTNRHPYWVILYLCKYCFFGIILLFQSKQTKVMGSVYRTAPNVTPQTATGAQKALILQHYPPKAPVTSSIKSLCRLFSCSDFFTKCDSVLWENLSCQQNLWVCNRI